MRSPSTMAVTTGLGFYIAGALAAAEPQWPRPGAPQCAATTTTAFVTVTASSETTKYATFTSTSVYVDPSGGSWTSTSTVVGPTSGAPTCEAHTATLIKTAPAATITVTKTAPYPTGNSTTPPVPTGTATPPKQCITDKEGEELAEVFRLLIQEYSDELALAALTEDFVDYSSAVNILMNKGAQYPKNISGPTFSTRQQFMDGQGAQPLIPFERVFTTWGCNTVSVRWWSSRSGAGQKTEAAMVPVWGNGIMEVVPSAEPVQTFGGVTYNWRVKTLFSEFNAAAWLINLGVFVPAGKVDYLNATNATVKRDVEDFNFDFRGAMI